MAGVLITHASADGELAAKLSELLEAGAGIPRDQIVAGSAEDQTDGSASVLRRSGARRLADFDAVVHLLTSSFYRSPTCMATLGAAWAVGTRLFVLLAPQMANDSVDDIA